jgi:hypothetical protein
MTRLVCPSDTGDPPCQIEPGDRTCRVHLVRLVPAPDPAEPGTQDGTPPADGSGGTPGTADGAGRTPSEAAGGAAPGPADGAGGRAGPDPDRVTCWRCQRNLPDPALPQCPQCRAEQPGPALALVFETGVTGVITLERGERTQLGRSRETPHAKILSAPNISQLHAVVWVDDDGAAWIKDTNSTNGTFVNGNEAMPEQQCLLTGGYLRLGAGNRARIHLRRSDR